MKKKFSIVPAGVLAFFNTTIARAAGTVTFTPDENGGITINAGTGVSLDGKDYMSGLASFIDKYKEIGMAIIAICLITCVLSFVINGTKLAHSGGDERRRKEAITGIGLTLIAVILLGGIGGIIGFAWKLLG